MKHPGNHRFMREIGLERATAEWRRASEIIRAYNAWMFNQLASGRAITIFGVGTIAGNFRKGRVIEQRERTITQPDTYSLKLRPAPRLKEAIRALAANPNESHYRLATKDGHHEQSYRIHGRIVDDGHHDQQADRPDHCPGEGSTQEERADDLDERTAGSHAGPAGTAGDSGSVHPTCRPGAICESQASISDDALSKAQHPTSGSSGSNHTFVGM